MAYPQDKQAYIRCDASPEIGGGHVVRCLTLARQLEASGWQCTFISTDDTLNAVTLLKNAGYSIIPPEHAVEPASLLIVDHYGLDRIYEHAARQWAKYIVVIDDLADRAHNCDILIDQTYGRDAADYKHLVPAHCSIFTGTPYALLRPQFAQIRKKLKDQRNGTLENIFAFFSTNDPYNTSGFMIEALEDINTTFNIDLVLSKGAPHYSDMKSIAAGSKHNISIHSDVENMAALMARADLAIGAGGTTSWERCCLGLPTILIEIADNQTKIAHELQKAGAISFLGRYQDITKSDLRAEVERLLHTPENLISMGETAYTLCDGLGAERVCTEIEQLVAPKE